MNSPSSPDDRAALAPEGGLPEAVEPPDPFLGRVEELPLEEDMRRSFLRYAMSVIVSRALPDVRDGLKPSQRRILYAMHDLNLGPRAGHRKCATIVGETMGKYHPHGDEAIYPTLARLAQPWNLRYPLVDGQGNFGSVDGDEPAAMRYTEARMTALTLEMLEDLDKEAVDFQPNFDETRTEPKVLPAKLPHLLVNGSQGIAVGMATNIPPHNLGEVCDALVRLLESEMNPERGPVTAEELLTIIQGPDFPTGGAICGKSGIRRAYLTGRGRLVVRGKVVCEQDHSGAARLTVVEIPYGMSKETLRKRLLVAVEEGRVKGVADVVDESCDEVGIKLVIHLKRGENPEVVLNQLYEYTPLQSTFGVINIALVGGGPDTFGRPRTLSLRQLLEHFLEHRREVVRRRTRFLLRKAEERQHIVEGLLIAVEHIAEVVRLIREADSPDLARQALMERFSLTDRQARTVLEMRLRQLTALERDRLRDEHQELTTRIADYQAILADHRRVLDLIRGELVELKEKYGDPRRTEITDEEIEPVDEEDLIREDLVVVTVSSRGYLKREPVSTYRVQARRGMGVTGQKLADGDFTAELFTASTHDQLLFFTNDGKVYARRVFEVPQFSRTARGRAIEQILELTEGQRVVALVPLHELDGEGSVVMMSRNNYIKRCALELFANLRRQPIIAMKLEAGDEVLDARYVGPRQDIVIATRLGMAVRIGEHTVRAMGRAARGVTGPRLQPGDRVVSLIVGAPEDSILTICEKGVGKRSRIADYRQVASQRAKGVVNIKITEKNGPVVEAIAVSEEDEVMVMSVQGKVIRLRVADVRPKGRATVGMYLMRLAEGDAVAGVARIARQRLDYINRFGRPGPEGKR